MKKVVLFMLIASVLLFTSCAGASMGAMLGGALGSAVGGISGGPRGHDVGLLVGAVGGAMVGAAVETAAEKQQEKQTARDQQQYREEKARLAANRAARQETNNYNHYNDETDNIYSDDVVDIDFGSDNSYVENLSPNAYDAINNVARIEIHNIRFIDNDGENVIKRGKEYQISFEIYNAGNVTAYNIEPSVKETATNGRIQVSPSILIESLAAHAGVRYTARLGSSSALKNGEATFTITCSLDGVNTEDETSFTIPTSKE